MPTYGNITITGLIQTTDEKGNIIYKATDLKIGSEKIFNVNIPTDILSAFNGIAAINGFLSAQQTAAFQAKVLKELVEIKEQLYVIESKIEALDLKLEAFFDTFKWFQEWIGDLPSIFEWYDIKGDLGEWNNDYTAIMENPERLRELFESLNDGFFNVMEHADSKWFISHMPFVQELIQQYVLVRQAYYLGHPNQTQYSEDIKQYILKQLKVGKKYLKLQESDISKQLNAFKIRPGKVFKAGWSKNKYAASRMKLGNEQFIRLFRTDVKLDYRFNDIHKKPGLSFRIPENSWRRFHLYQCLKLDKKKGDFINYKGGFLIFPKRHVKVDRVLRASVRRTGIGAPRIKIKDERRYPLFKIQRKKGSATRPLEDWMATFNYRNTAPENPKFARRFKNYRGMFNNDLKRINHAYKRMLMLKSNSELFDNLIDYYENV